MNIVSISEHEGKNILSIDTGMTLRSFGQSKMATELSGHGHLIHADGTVENWMAEGTYCDGKEDSSRAFIYGPAFDGVPLVAAIEGKRENAWKSLHTVISAISKAFLERGIVEADLVDIAGAGPGAILAGADGSVLLLPASIFIRCIGSHGEEAEAANRLLWIHPDHRTLNPLWAFSFMAGTLAYRIIAGVPPFGQMTATKRKMRRSEEIALDMRKGFFEPVDIAVWAVKPAAAACINDLISTKVATSTDTLVSFGPSIDSIIDPAKENVPESESFVAARDARTKKIIVAARREDFFRRYRNAFRVAAVALVAIGILGITYIRDMQAKPDTLGLEPAEVITGYYTAVATLDQEIPTAYAAKGVKTSYDGYITNLYVTSKVRLSYSGSGTLSPAQLYVLKDAGQNMIYGMTHLTVGDVQVSGKRAECEVSFFYWLPVTENRNEDEPADENAVALSVYAYTDRITLGWVKDRWKIAKIDEIRRDVLVADGTELVDRIKAGDAGNLLFAPTEEEIEEAKESMAHETAY